jgi:hypothetical protein
MNPSAVKLFLALLWLVPGVGLLAHDVATGQAIVLPIGRWSVPLSVPCLVLAAFNFGRWWLGRSRVTAGTPLLPRHRTPRRESAGKPNPAFRFDDPPGEAGQHET